MSHYLDKTHNFIIDNKGSGIWLNDSNDCFCENNIIKENYRCGIALSGGGNLDIINNIIEDNSRPSYGFPQGGIYLSAYVCDIYAKIKNNKINKNSIGMEASSWYGKNVYTIFTNNEVGGSDSCGIIVYEANHINLSNIENIDTLDDGGNEFYKNIVDIVNLSPDTLYAQGNDWWTSNPSLINQRIQWPVNYDYYAKNHIYYVDANIGSNTVDYFDAQMVGNGNPVSPWKTVTSALTDESPFATDTIRIAAGVYNTGLGEVFPLNLTNDVSLVGASMDSAIFAKFF